jgi:hypothetical protein
VTQSCTGIKKIRYQSLEKPRSGRSIRYGIAASCPFEIRRESASTKSLSNQRTRKTSEVTMNNLRQRHGFQSTAEELIKLCRSIVIVRGFTTTSPIDIRFDPVVMKSLFLLLRYRVFAETKPPLSGMSCAVSKVRLRGQRFAPKLRTAHLLSRLENLSARKHEKSRAAITFLNVLDLSAPYPTSLH